MIAKSVKLRLILSFFIIISLNTFSQKEHFVDSVVQSYSEYDDSILVQKLNELAFSYIVRSNENGIAIARESYKIASNKHNEFGKLDAIRCIGIDYDIKGIPDSANIYYESYLSKSVELKDSIRIGKAYNNMGMLNWHQGQFTEAIDLFYKYLKISEQLEDSIGIANSCSNIGLIYMELKQHRRSLSYSLRAYQVRKVKHDSIRIASSCNNIGISYKNINQFDSARYFYNEGINYALPINNERKLAELYTNLAKLYILKDDYQSGYDILIKTLNLNQSYSSKAALYNNLSEVCFLLDKGDEALKYAQLAYDLNVELASYGHLQNAYRNLANAYYLLKEYEKSRDYFMKWGVTKDSIFSENYANSIADLETKYQSEKKEKEIAKKDLEIAEQKLKLLNRNRLIAGSVSIILIILFLSLYVMQRIKRRSQKEKDEAIIKEKDKGLAAIIYAQEEERKRIAKDLHDGVVQNIAGIILAWRNLIGKQKVLESEKELLSNLESASEEIRSISHQMMPRSLSELGISAAIEDMLQKSLGHTDIDYSYESFGDLERLDEIIEINVFRVSQELINNVIKHSKASKVDIQLIRTKEALQLIVDDNGVGLSDAKSKGIGLRNIASRVESIHGELNIESKPKAGTLVRIIISINR